MAKYGLVIDISKCTGCYNCFLACRDEFAGNEYPEYSAAQPMSGLNWIKLIDKERGQFPKVKVDYIPMTCMHCENPTCVAMAQNGEVYKRDDGIVIIDPEKAKGQKDIVNTCPYRVIEWNEEANVASKCNMCAHLLDNGEKMPRCVETCPTEAIVFGDLDDPSSKISQLVATGKPAAMTPEFGLGEKVTYIDLPKKFIAGTVICPDKCEVAVGAKVTLIGSEGFAETTTDGFGDFEFEGLIEDADFTVKVELDGYKVQILQTKTRRDVYLGEIALEKQVQMVVGY